MKCPNPLETRSINYGKKDEEIKLPSVNPVEAVKEHINKREARVEQDKIDKIMQNIERYDGSPNGQVDVG